jgi:hypothetical protein
MRKPTDVSPLWLDLMYSTLSWICDPKFNPVELQAYLKPPTAVELTLAAVMTVLKKPPTWEEAKRQLGDSSFLESLLQYDKDRLDDVLLKKINRFTSNPDLAPEVRGSNPCPGVLCNYIIGRESAEFILSSVEKQTRLNMQAAHYGTLQYINWLPFSGMQAVEKVSLACKGLCMWVGAMEVYGNTVREVAPRRAKAAAAQQLLAKKEAALAESHLHLAEVLKKVEGLKVPIIVLVVLGPWRYLCSKSVKH